MPNLCPITESPPLAPIIACISPLRQETAQAETSTDPVQHGAVYAGVVGGVPGRLHAHGGLLVVPGGGRPSPLLHPGLVHVDVNGGTAAVPDVGQSAACHRRSLHPKSCPDCLGSVGLSVGTCGQQYDYYTLIVCYFLEGSCLS